MSNRRSLIHCLLALAAAVVVFGASATVALAAPNVTVRVEGEAATLLPATVVTLNAPEPVSGCPANSVAAAINDAVGGNWDHGEANSGGGDFTETILGETHSFTHESDTWTVWVRYRLSGGICTELLSEGDEVVLVADHEPEPWYSPTVLPLVVTGAPAVVQAGVPFSVTVDAVHTPAGTFAEPGEGTPEPAAGATVTAGGVSAVSGSDGTTTLAIAQTGLVTLRATLPGDAPSRTFSVCVHNGNDGNCGASAGPGGGVAGYTVAAQPYKGQFALVADLSAIRDGELFSHGHGPRLLTGQIRAHSAVSAVDLELRRSYRGLCSSYDGSRERFVRARCGRGVPFQVATGGSFSYLLPAALAPGRYVLDVSATDIVGNTLAPARGTSRLVFYVR